MIRFDIYPQCGQCSAPAEKEYVGKANAVHQDSIIGGMWMENLGHEPVFIESKQQLKEERKKRGLMEFVRHTPLEGSDKSPYTSNWNAISKETLENAKAVLEAHAKRNRTQGNTNTDEDILAFTMRIKDRRVSDPLPDRWEDGSIIKGRERSDY